MPGPFRYVAGRVRRPPAIARQQSAVDRMGEYALMLAFIVIDAAIFLNDSPAPR